MFTCLHAFVTYSTRFAQKLKLQATNTRRFEGIRLQATHAAKVRITCTHFCSQVSHIVFSVDTTKYTHFIMLCVKSGNMGNIPMVLSGVSALYYKEAGKFT